MKHERHQNSTLTVRVYMNDAIRLKLPFGQLHGEYPNRKTLFLDWLMINML